MTTDQLRAYLDAHGVDGAPTVPGWYVVDSPCWTGDYGIGLCIWRNGDGQFFDKTGSCAIVERQDVDRHASLPEFGAMARELAELRAKVEDLDMRARTMCIDCCGTGEGEGEPCDTCDGRKWVYRRRADWVTP